MRKAMFSSKRQFGSMLAQVRGKSYEGYFENTARSHGLSVLRIPQSGMRYLPGGREQKTTSPFDYVVGYKGLTSILDVKSSKDKKAFSYSAIHDKPHQMTNLILFYANGNGCRSSGMIVFFERIEEFVFFHVNKLVTVQPGSSLKPDEGDLIGKIDSLNHNFDCLFSKTTML